MCYEIHLADYGEDQVFHIVCCNFKVLVEGPEPFDDERGVPQIVAAPILAPVEGGNMDLGVKHDGNIATMLALEIRELTADGVLVDDEGPAPENSVPQPLMQTEVGMWEKQLICIHQNNTAITDTNGRWKLKSWKQIGQMTEFAIFQLAFPEEYIKTVIIQATNKHLPGESLTLKEFYVWLGCRFFMACYDGDFESCAWWSKKAITVGRSSASTARIYGVGLVRCNFEGDAIDKS